MRWGKKWKYMFSKFILYRRFIWKSFYVDLMEIYTLLKEIVQMILGYLNGGPKNRVGWVMIDLPHWWFTYLFYYFLVSESATDLRAICEAVILLSPLGAQCPALAAPRRSVSWGGTGWWVGSKESDFPQESSSGSFVLKQASVWIYSISKILHECWQLARAL